MSVRPEKASASVPKPGRWLYGPVWPNAGQAHDDEPRVDGVERLGREVEPLEDAGPEALDERVGGLDQAEQGLAPLRVLEIERDRALVAADREPPGRARADELAHRARGVAVAGALDLDHLGAEIRQVLADARARDDVRELDDPEVGEWEVVSHANLAYYPGG